MLREGSSVIASFVEHPVFSNFKMYSVLRLVFYFNFATINPNCMCKSPLFLKFQVLREGSSFTASFVEHPVCSNFKIYSVLILVFLYWFATINPKYMCKFQFSCEIVGAPRKKQCYCFIRGAPWI